MRATFCPLAVLVGLLSSVGTAAAQEERWSADFARLGANENVICALDYNGALVVGGQFTEVGATPVNYIAQWNGAEWSPLGEGTDAPVYALATYHGELIAGGLFSTAGGQYSPGVARWTGTEWLPFDDAIYGAVWGLQVLRDTLYAVGRFSTSSYAFVHGVTYWTGTQWRPVGDGLLLTKIGQQVECADVYRDQLVVGGRFVTSEGSSDIHNLASWSSGVWGQVGPGTSDEIKDVTVLDTLLTAGGFFCTLPGDYPCYIASWDGSQWAALGSGLDHQVQAVGTYQGTLYAGGAFWQVARQIASWDGTAWSTVGGGIDYDHLVNREIVQVIYESQFGMVTGGLFNWAEGLDLSNLALWSGANWSTFGPGNPLGYDAYALASYDGSVYAGGAFTSVAGQHIQYIARWDGTHWQELGGGTSYWVHAFTQYGSDLVVGGGFAKAGGILVNGIARWNGTAWLGGFGTGMNAPVRALTQWGDALVAGGDFVTAGGVSCSHVGQWNGTAWQPLGAGLNNAVYALCVYNGELYAAGKFSASANTTLRGIARWDGAQWQPVANGLFLTNGQPGVVNALAVHDGRLIAGGFFAGSGDIVSTNVIAWDGTAWAAIATAIPCQFDPYTSAEVNALASDGDTLYVGGAYGCLEGGSVAARSIATWTNGVWGTLTAGVDGRVNAIATDPRGVYLGGSFLTAGATSSQHIAQWKRDIAVSARPSEKTGFRHDPGLTLLLDPVPVRGTLTVHYTLPAVAHVTIAIYDTRGALVTRLEEGIEAPGAHVATWRPRTAGARHAAGVYVVELLTPDASVSRPVVVVE